MGLIGLTGKAGSGKDTVAAIIERLYPSSEFHSFAGPLKDGCAAMFGWNREALDHNREFKEAIDPRYGFSPRYAMQTLGTEWGRDLMGEDVWLNALATKYASSESEYFVVRDVRFKNEAEWVRKSGGVILYIVRPDAPDVIAHPSEDIFPPDPLDIVIDNDGTILDLEDKIAAALDKFLV